MREQPENSESQRPFRGPYVLRGFTSRSSLEAELRYCFGENEIPSFLYPRPTEERVEERMAP
jgi:hypothetical protein